MNHLIAGTLLPLVLCIVCGFALKRSAWLDDGFWPAADKLNYYVFFPALLFLSLADTPLVWRELEWLLAAALGVQVLLALGFWLAKAVRPVPAARFGVYWQANARFNTFIGFSLVSSLLGEAGMALFSLIIALYIPLVNVLSVCALSSGVRYRALVWAVAKNPLVLSCAAGLAVQASDWEMWAGLGGLLKLLAAPSLPLGLLSIGAALKLNAAAADSLWTAVHTFSRLVLVPLAAFAAAWACGLTALQTQVLVLFFALPTASASYTLTKVLGGDATLMANIISLQTFFSALTLPAAAWLLMRLA